MLGFACVIAGRDLKASDGRKPKSGPHLKHSLTRFLQVLDYLEEIDVKMFRIPSNFIPYATHPDYPEFAWRKQIKESVPEIRLVRDRLAERPVRLSFHPSQFILLNSPRPEVVKKSIEELRWQARILDLLGCSDEARVLLHVGGAYDDRRAAEDRLYKNIERLPEYVFRRFALENDDRIWNSVDTRRICLNSGVPMIFDVHHHACLNNGEPWLPELKAALSTWPQGVVPKIHFSSTRLTTEKAFNIRAHSDYIDPFAFQRFSETCEKEGLRFDTMLEAKAKELAILELRKNIPNGICSP